MTIRGTTQIVGVWGWPVTHSASPAMHNAAFDALGLDWVYVPFPVMPERIGDAVRGVRALGLRGVNVTVPLKEIVAPFLDEVSETARTVGAVNTVVNREGHLFGDSTDGAGFLASLAHVGTHDVRGCNVLILGAGGSARAVVYALLTHGARVVVANRRIERAQALADDFAPYGSVQPILLGEDVLRPAILQADVLVNTTSVGMLPNVGDMPPVPPDAFRPGLVVCDLIYNPWQTRFLEVAAGRGCVTQNGAEMLVRQGATAFEMWTGLKPPLDAMRASVSRSVRGE